MAVVVAVVHGHQCEREIAGVHTIQTEGGEAAEEALCLFRAGLHVRRDFRQDVHLRIADVVCLLGDGQGDQLQRRRAEDLADAVVLRAQLQAFGDRADDILLEESIRMQGDGDSQIVIRAVDAVDDLLIVRLTADDAGVHQTGGHQTLNQHCRERAEDVACAEVQPLRFRFGAGAHCRNIVSRQTVANPVDLLVQTFKRKLHTNSPILLLR